MEEYADVVVVGAGPVGLLAAIELNLASVRVLVLERLAAPCTTIKALAVGALGSEALQRRGMAEAIAAEEIRSVAAMTDFMQWTGADLQGRASRFSGHFAGLSLIRRDAQKEPERRAHIVDQPCLEALLGERARSRQIEVRRDCEVTSFVQHADGVDVDWASRTGAGRIRCAYLVGCDGGRSLVRKMAGFDFPGTAPTLTMYQAVAEFDHPERLLPIGWRRTSRGVFSLWAIPRSAVHAGFPWSA